MHLFVIFDFEKYSNLEIRVRGTRGHQNWYD